MEGRQQDPADRPLTKRCAWCGEERPIGEFRRRTGRRAGPHSRRGACRECRRRLKAGGAEGKAGAGAARPKPDISGTAVRAGSAAAGGTDAAGPGAAGADSPRLPEPAAAGAAGADKRPGADGPRPAETGTEAGREPHAAPDAKRKRKRRRGKRGGRKRNKGRRAQAEGAAADSAAAPAAGNGGEAEPARADEQPREGGRRKRRKAALLLPPPPPPPHPKGLDPSVLSPGKSGRLWMQGRSDKGRRWRQETDLETAVTLVREYAAVVVNRRTIRRLYTNKAFREYILKRDNYTCCFCGKYGDTIDHIVPRAKGGHTTPLNCVTACRECNQNKAALDLEEFLKRLQPEPGEPT